MFLYAEQLINQGNAYCDNTSAEEMKKQREERVPSPHRDACKMILILFLVYLIHIVNCFRYRKLS